MSDIKESEIVALHKRIGLNVKKIREMRGLSQLELTLAIGHRSTTIISQAELGKNKHFNIEQLHKKAKVLNCTMCDFIKE